MRARSLLHWAFLVVCLAVFANAIPTNAAIITEVKPGVPFSLRIPDTDLDVSGYVSPGSLVTIVDGTTVIGTTTANGSGYYSVSFVSQTPGIHIIHVFYEDNSGLVSSSTTDLIALSPKTLTTRIVNPAPTVSNQPSSLYVGEQITFSGQTKPNSTVELFLDNNLVIKAVSDNSGKWTAVVSTVNYFTGFHSYNVKSYSAGYNSVVSQKYQFQVLKNPNSTNPSNSGTNSPTTKPKKEALITAVTDPGDGYVNSGNDLVLTGTGPPNTQIEIYLDGVLVGSVFTNVEGVWTFKIYASPGKHEVKTRACTSSGCGPFSESTNYFFTGSSAACSTELWLDEYRFNRSLGKNGVDIDIRTNIDNSKYDLTVDWGDITVDHLTHEQPAIRLHHNYPGEGNYNGIVTLEQEEDCSKTVYFSVSVVQSRTNYLQYLLYIIVIFAIFILYYTFSKRKHEV